MVAIDDGSRVHDDGADRRSIIVTLLFMLALFLRVISLFVVRIVQSIKVSLIKTHSSLLI